jgi:hypothetical protein
MVKYINDLFVYRSFAQIDFTNEMSYHFLKLNRTITIIQSKNRRDEG